MLARVSVEESAVVYQASPLNPVLVKLHKVVAWVSQVFNNHTTNNIISNTNNTSTLPREAFMALTGSVRILLRGVAGNPDRALVSVLGNMDSCSTDRPDKVTSRAPIIRSIMLGVSLLSTGSERVWEGTW